ncbi:MAG TPA: GNAT family N-acetyltransferase, partial [Phycisphaerales bacterium]|nr:GNAT family N-acetyltransferase [Phycisphaerales bacterium]
MTSVVLPSDIRLRPTQLADVQSLFQFQLDVESNRMAGTKPRDRHAFTARWEEILRDPCDAGVTPRVIVANGELVGSINIVREAGREWIGYWIARKQWGRGIATKAVGLMLDEVRSRPIFARAAGSNTASLRVLEKNG